MNTSDNTSRSAPPAENAPGKPDSDGVEALDKKYAADAPSAEFAALLDESDVQNYRTVSPGEKITGTIREIGPSVAFIDFGGRSEASMDSQNLRDKSGALKYEPGDTLEAFVASTDGEIRLTLSLRASTRQMVRRAHQNGMPIEGKVTGFNSGGLVVNVGGLRGFCPMSQIDTGYCHDPASYAGQTLTFKIVELPGRDSVVVSRRAYLRDEIRKKADEVRRQLSEGDERSGVITRIEHFGAFVDLDGVEGLLHVSEISHARVKHPREALKKGQEVRVKILGIKNLGKKRERVSLSLKALEKDPWDKVADRYHTGNVITGKVVSIQNFGAFVELEPGVEGLIHISQFVSGKRIANPGEVVSVGDEIEAMIREIDPRKKRVSLSVRAVEEAARQTAEKEDMAAFKSNQPQESQSDNAMAEALRRAGLA